MAHPVAGQVAQAQNAIRMLRDEDGDLTTSKRDWALGQLEKVTATLAKWVTEQGTPAAGDQPPEVQQFLAELAEAPAEDADTWISKGMNLLKKTKLAEMFTAPMGGRELKDLMLALARHTGDVQDRAGQGTKGEPDPCLLVMIQEHGFCQHCKGDVSLPGILAIGNVPKELADYEGRGYHMNWVGTKHRASFQHPAAS